MKSISRTTLIIIIIALIILVLGGVFIFYSYSFNQNGTSSDATTGQTSTGLFGFLPFGKKNTPSSVTGDAPTTSISQNQNIDVSGQNSETPSLRQISTLPTAGIFFFERLVSTTTEPVISTSTGKIIVKSKTFTVPQTFIRYIDRAQGYIFETSTSTTENTRITNTTKTKIYEAYPADGAGNSFIYRSLIGSTDVIKNEFVSVQKQTVVPGSITSTSTTNIPNLSGTSTDATLASTPLPFEITSLAVSPLRDSIFYILSSNPRGVTSKTNGTNKTTIFDSPLKEWLVGWVNSKTIAMTTKPSANVFGYLYFLNPQTKSFTKILGGINGLTANVSPDAKNILYSENDNGSNNLNLYQPDKNTTQKLFVHTLSEKCTWSKNSVVVYCAVPSNPQQGNYPDIWYQGLVSFNDNLWALNTNTGEAKLLVNPNQLGLKSLLDITNISLDSNEDSLVFINKNDLSPWVLKIPALNFATSTPKK